LEGGEERRGTGFEVGVVEGAGVMTEGGDFDGAGSTSRLRITLSSLFGEVGSKEIGTAAFARTSLT
jgi:hypothetical protein